MYRNHLPSKLSMEESPTQSAKMLVQKIGEAPLKEIIAIQLVNKKSCVFTQLHWSCGWLPGRLPANIFYIMWMSWKLPTNPKRWGDQTWCWKFVSWCFWSEFSCWKIGALFGFGHISCPFKISNWPGTLPCMHAHTSAWSMFFFQLRSEEYQNVADNWIGRCVLKGVYEIFCKAFKKTISKGKDRLPTTIFQGTC